MADRTLVLLSYSPWSERARFSMDHHGLGYRVVDHTPFLGELRLRKLVGKREQRATVPVLVADGELFTNSWDIARYADREGGGEKLIPDELEPQVRELDELTQATMGHGRALVVAKLLRSGPALDATLPPWVPGFVRPLCRPVTRYGTAWFGRKYSLELADDTASREALRTTFTDLRRRLGNQRYFLGRFTFADIAVASLLQGITPLAERYLPLAPALREVWTQPELASEFSDLLAWRDRLYAEHRKR